jgi:putative redox protein
MEIEDITGVSSQFRGTNYTTTIKSDDHELIADEPVADGGQNAGFDPFELVLAALATCTTATMKMYADRKQWKLDKIDIQLDMRQEDGVQRIHRSIQVSGELTEEQKARLLVIAEKCPVHKMLTNPNKISTTLA